MPGRKINKKAKKRQAPQLPPTTAKKHNFYHLPPYRSKTLQCRTTSVSRQEPIDSPQRETNKSECVSMWISKRKEREQGGSRKKTRAKTKGRRQAIENKAEVGARGIIV
jgi:hypothetical protein